MLRAFFISGHAGVFASLCACGGDITTSASDSSSQSSSGTTLGPTTGGALPTSSQGTVTDGEADSDSSSHTSSPTATGAEGTTGEVETKECLSDLCTVPNSHETIQAAVDDLACDVVNVCPGIYYENIVFHRSLTLKRAPVLGEEPVVIDGAGKGRVLTMVDDLPNDGMQLDVVLKRLTLQNGDSSAGAGEEKYEKGGGGLFMDSPWGNLLVDSCVIQNNKAVKRGGGMLVYGPVQIVETKVLGNTVVDPEPENDFPFVRADGGGVKLIFSHSEIIDSLISQNSVVGAQYKVTLQGGGLAASCDSLSIVGTDIVDNHVILQQDPALDVFPGTTQVQGNGGGLVTDVDVLEIVDSHVDGNTIDFEVDDADHPLFFFVEGGGLYLDGGDSVDVVGTTFNENKLVVTGAWTGTGFTDQDWRVQWVGGGGIAFFTALAPKETNFTDVSIRGNAVTVAATIMQNSDDPMKSGTLWAGGGGVSMQTIYNCPENVTLTRADISANTVAMTQNGVEDAMLFLGQGGGMFGCSGPSKDSLRLRDVTLAENTIEISNSPGWAQYSSGEGAGLFVEQPQLNSIGRARVSQSTLLGNTIHSNGKARGAGAAVATQMLSCENTQQHATVIFENTTFHQNSAEDGAGSSQGGGLWLHARLPAPSDDCLPSKPEEFWQQIELSNVTVTENVAREGGGIHMAGLAAVNYTRANIRNSLVYGNQALKGPDCFTVGQFLTSLDYNIFQTLSQCGLTGEVAHNVVGQDPQLAQIADNGGFTQTQAITQDGVAATLGRPGSCADHEGNELAVDQRGYQRPVGGRCDIGAYEAGAKPF